MVHKSAQLALLFSVLVAVLTANLKFTAYWLTDSVGMLSDAAESIVNLLAASVALWSLRLAAVPRDANHSYGHDKIAYFSSGFEGALVLVAGVGIIWMAIDRLINPRELARLDLGLVFCLGAAAINGGMGWWLVRLGKSSNLIILEADGQHLLTDFWTSVALVIGIGMVMLTGLTWFDPVMAIIMAIFIIWTAVDLLLRSFDGLMDRSLTENDLDKVKTVIATHVVEGMTYHALRSRHAGSRIFIDFHLLVPGSMSVKAAHDLMERLENELRVVLPGTEATIHLEPIEDSSSWDDLAR